MNLCERLKKFYTDWYSPTMKLQDQSPRPTSSFAALLANLTKPAAQTAASWLEEDPAQDSEADILTLSYERALRLHGRYRPIDPPVKIQRDKWNGAQVKPEVPPLVTPPGKSEDNAEGNAEVKPDPASSLMSTEILMSLGTLDELPIEDASLPAFFALQTQPERQAETNPEIFCEPESKFPWETEPETEPHHERTVLPPPLADVLPDKYKGLNLPLLPPTKNASITLRVSEEEASQLRKRAREAGLTVSAYIRSCTFEAELLRCQVKEALTDLRVSSANSASASSAKETPRWWVRPFVSRSAVEH